MASALASVAQTTTVLIDGTAAGGYILNGSFEGGLSPWVNIGANVSATSSAVAAADGTSFIAVGISSTAPTYNQNAVAVNTAYAVAAGDTFSLSFQFGNRVNADIGDAGRWWLLTTSDNALTTADYTGSGISNLGASPGNPFGGDVTILSSGSFTLTDVSTTNWYSTGTITTTAVANDYAGLGRQVWFALTPGANTANAEFIRVDQVNLSVTSVIPEPSTAAALAGLGALGVAAYCRRRRA